MRSYDRNYRELRRGFSMRPYRGEGRLDPNYHDGEYFGERLDAGYEGQAAYGRHRLRHAGDLGGFGGFSGRYDAGRGYMDEDGVFQDPFDAREEARAGGVRHPYHPRDFFGGGGRVSRDMRYLEDYNAYSPALRRGYDRSFGYAEGGGRPNAGGRQRGEDVHPRDPNRYGGYSTGGFSEPWLPKQANRGSHGKRK